MKWRIFIAAVCLLTLNLQAQSSTPAPAPVAVAADVDDASTKPGAVVQTSPALVAAAVPVETVDAAALEKAKAQLKEKDALIERLSNHLESALARLNENTSPISANTSVTALNAAKAQLEQQNNTLKAREAELLARMDELSRKSQLLDLENRQMFEALNGKPYQEEKDGMYVAKGDASQKNSSRLAREE